MSFRGVTFAVVSVLALAGCATTKKDVTGSGDDRLDEGTTTERAHPKESKDDGNSDCGSGPGDLVLIDGRSGNPISCASVTLSRDIEGCEPSADSECPTEVLLKARTNSSGQIKLPDPALANKRLWAVSEGFQASPRDPAPIPAGKTGEIEMIPEDGFLLKFIDSEGNYLPNLSVSFKQGDAVIAQMRTNEYANVYFNERTPFGGEPVVVEAEGYPPITVTAADLTGNDNTVTLKK